jgi:hypothetical protein
MSMYTVRITHIPAAGKANDLCAALEEHSKASNAAGLSYAVSQPMYTREPSIINSLRYDNLAALEAYQQTGFNDPAAVARRAKIAPCLARPQTAELFETLVQPRLNGARASYVLRVSFYPALGRFGELRQLLEERARTPATGTISTGLAAQVAAEEGQNLVAAILFPSLAALEEFRKANQTDSAFQTFQAKLAGLVTRTLRQSLERVLVPFGAR